MTEDDVSALRLALEERDIIVREPQEETRPVATSHVSGTLDPLQLFMDAAGRHKLLTAADEVHLAKRIEKVAETWDHHESGTPIDGKEYLKQWKADGGVL